MPSEFQFLARSENTQPRQSFIFGGLLHKHSFGKIHFARDGQHGDIAQAIAIGYHRERIALKARCSENDKGVVTAFHWGLSVARATCWAVRRTRAGRRSFR